MASQEVQDRKARRPKTDAEFAPFCPADSPLKFSVTPTYPELGIFYGLIRVEVTPKNPTSPEQHQDAIRDFAKHVMDPISRCENVMELVLSRVAIDLVQLEQLLRQLALHRPPPEYIRLQNVTLVEPSGPVTTSPFLTHKFRSIKVIDDGSPAVLSDILMWVQQVGCVEIGHSSSGKENRGPSVALKERAQSQRIIAGEFKASTEDLCWLDVFDQKELRLIELSTPRGRGVESGPSTTTWSTSLKAKFRNRKTEQLPLKLKVLGQFPDLYRVAIYAHLDDFSQRHTDNFCLLWTDMPLLDSYFMQVTLDTQKGFNNPLKDVLRKLCHDYCVDALKCRDLRCFTFRCAELPSEEGPFRSLSRNVDLAGWLRDSDTHAWREVHDEGEQSYVYSLNVHLRGWMTEMHEWLQSPSFDCAGLEKSTFEAQYIDFNRGIYVSFGYHGWEARRRAMIFMISPHLQVQVQSRPSKA